MKIIKDELVKEILKMYFDSGKSIAEIAKQLAPKYEGWTAYNKEIDQGKGKEITEEYLYLLTQKTIALANKRISHEDISQIKQNKANLQQESENALKLEVADAVRNLYIDLSGNTVSEIEFNKAISTIAARKNLSKYVVKSYTNEVYPYLYPTQTEEEMAQYYVELAERIIKNGGYIAVAAKNPKYSSMRKYIKENRPDLHQQLELLAQSNLQNVRDKYRDVVLSDSTRVFKSDMCELIIQIILTYRVPVTLIVEFINNNADLFLKNDDKITPEELSQLNGATSQMEFYALKFFYSENSPEFEEYKISVFNEFVAQFNLLKGDTNKQIRFIKAQTSDKIASVLEKTKSHVPGAYYNFTNDEYRAIIKTIYKYAITEEGIKSFFGMQSVRKNEIVSRWTPSEFPEDQMLLKGVADVAIYNQEISGFPQRS